MPFPSPSSVLWAQHAKSKQNQRKIKRLQSWHGRNGGREGRKVKWSDVLRAYLTPQHGNPPASRTNTVWIYIPGRASMEPLTLFDVYSLVHN